MARHARIIVPGFPHHVTQRGNRREPIFFEDGDQEVYRDLLGRTDLQARRRGLGLLPDAQPCAFDPRPIRRDGAGPRRGRGPSTHHQLHQCARALDRPSVPKPVLVGGDGRKSPDRGGAHVSLNPVRARLARKADDWVWSSVRAHLARRDDELVSVVPVLNRVNHFAALLETDLDDEAFRALRSSEGSGRPLGNADFIADLERLPGRPVARRAPGRKSKSAGVEQLDLLK